MRKRLPVILSILWFAILLILYWRTEVKDDSGTYTAFHDSDLTEDYLYVSETRSSGSYIYQIDGDGYVQNIVKSDTIMDSAQFVKIACYNDEVYALLLGYEDVDDMHVLRVFLIAKLDKDLHVLSYTDPVTFDEYRKQSSLFVDESGIYMTFVDFSGIEATGFRFDFEQLVSVEERMERGEDSFTLPAATDISPIYACEAPRGRFYVDAEYDGDALYTRTDDGAGAELFIPDVRVRKLFDEKKLSAKQIIFLNMTDAHYWLMALVIGEIFIFLGHMILKNRNRVVYLSVMVEAVILIICVIGLLAVEKIRTDTKNEEYERFSTLSMENLQDRIGIFNSIPFDKEDFYNSEEYAKLQNQLCDFIYEYGNSQNFYDIMIVRTKNGAIVASGSGRNLEPLEQVYTQKLLDLANEVSGEEPTAFGSVTLTGEDYGAAVLADVDTWSPAYVLIGITNRGVEDLEETSFREGLSKAMLVFIMASIACLLLLWRQSSDLRKLSLAMQAMAKGSTEVHKPAVLSGDTADMWNSLSEIGQNVRRVNRTKYLMLEAYYRFAPKKIEKILGRDSITEVESGETIVMSGTVAIISSDERKIGQQPEIQRMNQLISMIGKYQDEQKGILISNDSELSLMKLLFFSDNRSTHDFGIDFIKEFEANSAEDDFPLSLLLCFADFSYGIAGTSAQSVPFFISDEAKQLEGYSEWFRKLGIRLVITADVKNREFYDEAVRFIGHVKLAGSNKDINLFEVLNAYNERERHSKIDSGVKFQNALQLFYKKDFYLARSAFSDIIKDDHSDGMAKWYLFECERYLNEVCGDDFTGSLHL